MIKDINYSPIPRYKIEEPTIYNKFVLGMEAKIAVEMVQKWGVVAAVENGEDSTGRARVKLMSTKELINRACEAAELLIEEFEKREWLLYLPGPKEK